ncbi:hypothetical protein BC831DRAFT_158250, partial [Entophlyctis helioformis]
MSNSGSGGAAGNPGGPKPNAYFFLDRNMPCGEDYAGFPIVLYSSSSEAQTLARQILANLANVEGEFFNDYGCSSATVRPALDSLRYQSSLRCSELVDEALKIGAKPLPEAGSKNPILCPDRCDLAVSTFKMVLRNATACPSAWTQAMDNRNNTIDRYETYCKSIGPQSGNTCNKGAVFERDLCGKWPLLLLSSCQSVSLP